MATASEDMQIMCFGDVYVAEPEPSIEQKRPALEERSDSSFVQPLPTTPATPASIHDEPVRAAESPMSSPPSSPCRRSFHRRQSSDSSKRELLRSLFSPATLKGRLAQVLQGDVVLPRDDSLYAPKGAIRVHLSRDEELKLKQLQHASDYSDTTTSQITIPSPPPAYGAWRCSVRADPSLLHWHKVDVNAGDSAAVAEPELAEAFPSSPTVVQAWSATGPMTAVNEEAVSVSIGRARPAIVDIRRSGSFSGSSSS